MKKVKLFEQFINENSAWAKANKKAEDLFGEFGIAYLDDSQLADIIDIKKADKLADKMFGEFGFSSLSEDEMEELLTKNPKILKESLNEGKWSKIMTGVKKGAKSGPWAIVVIKDGKVVSQTQVEVMDAIPAFYEDVKKQYPNAKIRIEDNEGMIVYNESVVTEAKGKDLIQVQKLDWVDHTRLIKFISKEFGKLDVTVNRTGGYTIDPSGLSDAEVEILLDYLRSQKYIIEQKVDEAVRVETFRYKASHGKEPKGTGLWMFSYDKSGDEYFSAPNSMSYSDALKWVKGKAKEDNKSTVYVMESVDSI